MDADLFYVLAVVLLLAILLALLAGLSTLNSIKNAMAEGTLGASRDAGAGLASSASGSSGSSSYDLGATSGTQLGSAYTPATQTSYSEQVAATPETSYNQQEEVDTGFVSMAEVEPQLAQATGTEPVTLRGDEPEEQPFEREGRWWFKRGGELLVYEEGTGQWVPTSSGGAGGGTAAPATATFPATGGDVSVPQADSGEGWKCSSCGAVNGSTATSCRMCFTPR